MDSLLTSVQLLEGVLGALLLDLQENLVEGRVCDGDHAVAQVDSWLGWRGI